MTRDNRTQGRRLADLWDSQMEAAAHVSHFGALKTSGVQPVLKANFPSTALDTTLWTDLSTGTGTVTTQRGVASLLPNGTGGHASIRSVDQGIFEAGQVSVWQSGVMPGAPVVGNRRRWGMADATLANGLFFELNSTSFRIVARNPNSTTVVGSSAFSEDTTFTPSTRNNTFRIFYSAGRAVFCAAQQGRLRALHVMTDSQYPLVHDLDLGMFYENTNTGSTENPEMRIRGASHSVFGELPTIRANGALSDSQVLQPVKAVIAGRTSSGGYVNVGANAAGQLSLADQSIAIARGQVAGFNSTGAFGRNPDVDAASTGEDIWFAGGLYAGQPSSPSNIIVQLASTADDGVQVECTVLASSGSTAYTTVTLTGPTTSTGTYWRVPYAKVVGPQAPAGSVTLASTAGNWGIMEAGKNVTQIAAYTVPQGQVFILQRIAVRLARASGTAGSAEILLMERQMDSVYRAARSWELTTEQGVDLNFVYGIPFPAGTDLKGRISSVSDNNSIGTMAWEGVLVPE